MGPVYWDPQGCRPLCWLSEWVSFTNRVCKQKRTCPHRRCLVTAKWLQACTLPFLCLIVWAIEINRERSVGFLTQWLGNERHAQCHHGNNVTLERSDVTRQASAAWRPMLANYIGNYWSCFLLSGSEVITGDTYRAKWAPLYRNTVCHLGDIRQAFQKVPLCLVAMQNQWI